MSHKIHRLQQHPQLLHTVKKNKGTNKNDNPKNLSWTELGPKRLCVPSSLFFACPKCKVHHDATDAMAEEKRCYVVVVVLNCVRNAKKELY